MPVASAPARALVRPRKTWPRRLSSIDSFEEKSSSGSSRYSQVRGIRRGRVMADVFYCPHSPQYASGSKEAAAFHNMMMQDQIRWAGPVINTHNRSTA